MTDETNANGRAPYLGPAVRTPKIIEIAARAFASHGYRGASLRDMAAEAEVSKAVLYDCFPGGKLEMHAAVVARAEERFTDVVIATLEEPRRSPLAIFAGVARGLISFIEREPYAIPFLFMAQGLEEDSVEQLSRAREEAFNALTIGVMRALGATDGSTGGVGTIAGTSG